MLLKFNEWVLDLGGSICLETCKSNHFSDYHTKKQTFAQVYRDMAEWCKQFKGCQKTWKTNAFEVLLQAIMVNMESYEKRTFDIVRPFPRWLRVCSFCYLVG